VVAKDNLGCANPDVLGDAAANFFGHRLEILKERLDELVEFFAGRRQGKGPPMEERHAQALLQLNDLPADGWLLDAIRHVAHRFADAAVPGYVIKQFEVVDVHAIELADVEPTIIN
jgi:hypothetical protein